MITRTFYYAGIFPKNNLTFQEIPKFLDFKMYHRDGKMSHHFFLKNLLKTKRSLLTIRFQFLHFCPKWQVFTQKKCSLTISIEFLHFCLKRKVFACNPKPCSIRRLRSFHVLSTHALNHYFHTNAINRDFRGTFIRYP